LALPCARRRADAAGRGGRSQALAALTAGCEENRGRALQAACLRATMTLAATHRRDAVVGAACRVLGSLAESADGRRRLAERDGTKLLTSILSRGGLVAPPPPPDVVVGAARVVLSLTQVQGELARFVALGGHKLAARLAESAHDAALVPVMELVLVLASDAAARDRVVFDGAMRGVLAVLQRRPLAATPVVESASAIIAALAHEPRLKPHLRRQGAVGVMEECATVKNQMVLRRNATLAINLLRLAAGEAT
jgi:hypothetical protein